MSNKVQFRIVFLTYVISIGASCLLNYLKVNYVDYNGFIGALKITTILSIWWAFYFKWGWKLPLLNKILYRMNLSGTWYGTYSSVDFNKNESFKGDIVIRIKQDFLNLSIFSYTEKYKTYSYSEELKYEEKSDTHGLIYVYSQKENSPFDLDARNGTSDMKVEKYKDSYKLEGAFWTIQGTKGILKVTKVSKKIVDSFEAGQELYTQSNCKIKGEKNDVCIY